MSEEQREYERICDCCGFEMTAAEAKKNALTGLCFDCIVHGEDDRLDLMNRPDTWDEWTKPVYPDEGGKPIRRTPFTPHGNL